MHQAVRFFMCFGHGLATLINKFVCNDIWKSVKETNLMTQLTTNVLRVTLHWSLRALDLSHTNHVIDQEFGEGPSSFYTRPWGFEGPEEIWMDENLHDILHGTEWMIFHGLHGIVWDPLKRGRSRANWGAMVGNNLSLDIRVLDCHDLGHELSTILGFPWCILWSLNMVHFHFTLSSRAHQIAKPELYIQ